MRHYQNTVAHVCVARFCLLLAGLMLALLRAAPYAPDIGCGCSRDGDSAASADVMAGRDLCLCPCWIGRHGIVIARYAEFELFLLTALLLADRQLPRSGNGGRLSNPARLFVPSVSLVAQRIGVLEYCGYTWTTGPWLDHRCAWCEGFLLSLLLLLLARLAQREPAICHYFAPGAVLGLLSRADVSVLERWLFLADHFSSDIVPSGHSEMSRRRAALIAICRLVADHRRRLVRRYPYSPNLSAPTL